MSWRIGRVLRRHPLPSPSLESGSWAGTVVREILRRPLYIGQVVDAALLDDVEAAVLLPESSHDYTDRPEVTKAIVWATQWQGTRWARESGSKTRNTSRRNSGTASASSRPTPTRCTILLRVRSPAPVLH